MLWGRPCSFCGNGQNYIVAQVTTPGKKDTYICRPCYSTPEIQRALLFFVSKKRIYKWDEEEWKPKDVVLPYYPTIKEQYEGK